MRRVNRHRCTVFSTPSLPTSGCRNRTAFSLVEILVVVTIISILAALALPLWQRIQRRAKTAVIANDFRVFAAAFNSYAQETGGWPTDTAAGVLPAAMKQRIGTKAFTRTTPMGGKYNWEYNRTHFGIRYKAAITISAKKGAPLTLDMNQILDLEQAIDGGPSANLLDGNFRVGTGLVPLFVVEQ